LQTIQAPVGQRRCPAPRQPRSPCLSQNPPRTVTAAGCFFAQALLRGAPATSPHATAKRTLHLRPRQWWWRRRRRGDRGVGSAADGEWSDCSRPGADRCKRSNNRSSPQGNAGDMRGGGKAKQYEHKRTNFEQTRRHFVRPFEKIVREFRWIDAPKVSLCIRAPAVREKTKWFSSAKQQRKR
jgi:hypothetical protein